MTTYDRGVLLAVMRAHQYSDESDTCRCGLGYMDYPAHVADSYEAAVLDHQAERQLLRAQLDYTWAHGRRVGNRDDPLPS